MQIGNIEMLLLSIMIASACNKVLRKRILQPNSVGLIPTGGYIFNNNCSKKALVWLLHVEETDGVNEMRCGEYRLPELPRFIVDGYCPETRTFYEYFGCFYHGNTCQPFRGVATLRGNTLVERHERTMSRLEQITRAVYLVKVQWECAIDNKGKPIVEQSLLRTRDALYGGRTEAVRLRYKARENEKIQYVDVMSLCPIYAGISSSASAIRSFS